MLLRKRVVQMKVVKEPLPEAEPIDYDKVVKSVTKNSAFLVAAYIGADTVRRAILYYMSVKIV